MWCPKGSNIAEGERDICYSNISGPAFPLVVIPLVGLSIFPVRLALTEPCSCLAGDGVKARRSQSKMATCY